MGRTINTDYRIIVGVDSSKIKSREYRDEIQLQLNKINDLYIYPHIDLKALNTDIDKVRGSLAQLQKEQNLTLTFNEKELIQQIDHIAKALQTATDFTATKSLSESISKEMKGLAGLTKSTIGDIHKVLAEIHSVYEKRLPNTIKETNDVLSKLGVTAGKDVAGGVSELQDSVNKLVTALSHFDDVDGSFQTLYKYAESAQQLIRFLSAELTQNPIDLRVKLPSPSDLGADFDAAYAAIKKEILDSPKYHIQLQAKPFIAKDADGKNAVTKIDAEINKTTLKNSVNEAIDAVNTAKGYHKLKIDIDQKYFSDQFAKTFSAKMTINNFEDVDSKIATLKTQLHELQSAAKITIDDSDLEKLANSDIKTNAILDPQVLIETNKLLQEIILTLELFYDLVDDLGKINPISKVIDGDDFVKQLSLYSEAIQELKTLHLNKVEATLSNESDRSSPAYKKADKEQMQSRTNINKKLVELGATKEIREEINKTLDYEEQSLRIAHEKANVKKAEASQTAKQTENVRKANKLLDEYQNKSGKLAGLVGKESTEEYKAVQQEMEKVAKSFEDFFTSPGIDFGDKFNEIEERYTKIIPDKNKQTSLLKTAKLYDSLKDRAKEYEIELSNLDVIERKIQGMTIFEKQINNTPGYNTYLSNLKEARKILNDIHNAEATGQYDALDGYYKTLDDLTVRINAFYKAQQNINAAVIGDNKELDKLNKLGASLSQYLDNYEKKLKKLPSLYQKFLDLQRKLNNNEISAADATRELNQIQIAARAAGVEVTTLWDRLKKSFAGNFRGQLANTGWMLMSTSIRQVYQNVVQLDTAMTELKKVTNETEDAYIKFLDNAEDRAKKLGATLVDTVSATADMARLGYNIEDASNLADVALIYKNVGDGIENIDDASATIISTMQGFGIEAEKAIQIVDRFNEVANKYASSAGDIGAITKRSAAAMQVAGATLDETIALGVTANEVVQDAEQVGNGLKTLSMRLRSTKSDMEAAGEDTSGMADSVSKLRDEILAITGVDIQLDEDTYKTPYQILVEIGKVWDQLSDMERANVGEKLFGKQRANIGFAILENYERAEAILKTSQESAGSAFRENEIYLESIQGRLDKLAASWQSLSNNLLDSDTVKSAVSGANAVLDIVNAIVEKLGLMPGLLAAAGTVWAQHNHVGKECALLLRAA